MSDLLAGLAQWAIEIVYSFGYIGVAVLIGLINLHLLPVPTQVVLGLAGFLVGQGQFSFFGVLASSTVGALVASLILYALGFWVGEENLRQLITRLERFKLVFVADLERASEVFEHHGGKAILIGHLFPGIGALISIPAGIKRMPIFGQFMAYSVLGCILWNGGFIILGLVLGSNWPVIKQYAAIIEYAALTAIVGGVILLLWRRRKAWQVYNKHVEQEKKTHRHKH
jgi:membrane protein DedA with SNARE-associated domain